MVPLAWAHFRNSVIFGIVFGFSLMIPRLSTPIHAFGSARSESKTFTPSNIDQFGL
ncbi:hypothetical protein SISSUDRAFT_1050416 [Sistotremastrum suecicum HHB10207 ss-3]|uniref:Uncharacterized protein n=1 Tax=Sistotremastrum suecicum HHB10207 ss-3 TaxID=1314776 RepID=A0A166B6V5_9AGAM|nr:hypothetical protein SISSUDRAFT_1050416 [Sistotremastrum suecicum HHB10207 ss-3]